MWRGGLPGFRCSQQQPLAELVREIAAHLRLSGHVPKHVIALKRPQQFVMTRARLVLSRDQRVDDSQSSSITDSLRRYPHAASHKPIACRGIFEGTHDGRADCDNTAAAIARLLDQ